MHNHNKKSIFKKRFVTLIEMMIVMFLIALITGVVAYNYQGSLEKGKVFKSEQGIAKVENILSMALAEDPTIDLSNGNWQTVIAHSNYAKDVNSLVKDGWGQDYVVEVDSTTHVINVTSPALDAYRARTRGH